MSVLVVDDEVNVRFAIERRLKNEGIVTASASTVRQAMDRVRSEPFDVVVSDLRMPGGDGTQLLQWVGSYSPSTQVVVVSAFVTDEIRAQFPPSTGLRIMEKPVDLDVLVDVLQELGPRKGFFGNAIEVELFDYVQMVALSGRDKLINIKTSLGEGLVWFELGDVVHVQLGPFRGETAFYKILACNRGTFREQLFRPPPMRTVTRSSTHLLMEAARQMDEGTLGEGIGGVPQVVEDENSFAGVAADAAARASPSLATTETIQITEPDDLVLPADNDEHREGDEILGSTDMIGDEPEETSSAAEVLGVGSVFDDPETRRLMLDQFFEFEGVNGVAIVSSSGKVLAEDMGSNTALVTLAGFYMRGAARIARALGYNVFDGVIARSATGQQMLMVSMGGSSAVLSVEIGCDPEKVRNEIMGGV